MTPDNHNTAIMVRGLTKRFGEVQAVAGIDIEVREGELFGFLGPNGLFLLSLRSIRRSWIL